MRTLDIDIKEKDRVITIERGDNLRLILNLSDKPYQFKGEVVASSVDLKDDTLLPYSAVLLKV